MGTKAGISLVPECQWAVAREHVSSQIHTVCHLRVRRTQQVELSGKGKGMQDKQAGMHSRWNRASSFRCHAYSASDSQQSRVRNCSEVMVQRELQQHIRRYDSQQQCFPKLGKMWEKAWQWQEGAGTQSCCWWHSKGGYWWIFRGGLSNGNLKMRINSLATDLRYI